MQPAKVQNVQLEPEPWRDLGKSLAGLQTISISAGPGNNLFILAASPPLDYREHSSGASFAKISPDHAQDFTILDVSERDIALYEIAKQSWNYHQVQPLPDGELLLICGRSHYRTQHDYDLNAKVFDHSGKLKREFLLEDFLKVTF